VLAVFALALLPSTLANAGGPPATFTTINFVADDGNHCQNGNLKDGTIVNCNLYDGKQYVWLNGGPDNAALASGTYFFVVLVPGGQPDPNDGGAKNLSDSVAAPYTSGATNLDGSAIPSGDLRSNRTFTVSNGVIDYSGTHTFTNHMIRLMPYDDTTNNGGVYILGICKLASAVATVDPKDCKYDAFKVQAPETPLTEQAVLSGTKYRDHLGAGVGQLDPGETGLADWFISITDGTSTFNEPSQTTDSSGAWSFTTPALLPTDLPKTYTISETLKSGWRETGNTVPQFQVAGSANVTLTNFVYSVTITGTAAVSDLNFGNIPQGAVSGMKYRDDNKNGAADAGEIGLAGWSISQAGAASATLTTVSGGTFSTTLDPGTYTFTEVLKANWKQTGNTDANNQSAVTGGASAGLASFVYTVVIPNDQPSTVTGLNFGNIPQGTVSGLKYNDKDKSGTFTTGDSPLSGWTINYDSTSTATLVDGTFSLTLDPGTYTFAEVGQTGWRQTGNTTNQSSASGTGASSTLNANKTYTVVVSNSAPSTIIGLNFGNIPQGTVSGLKYNDMDKSGTYGGTDTTLGSWTINYTGGSTTTDNSATAAKGSFSVTLDPGTYTFAEVGKTGWRQTGNTSNQSSATGTGASTTLNADKTYTVVVSNSAPSTITGLNFGNIPQGTVSGLKYYDADLNGQNGSTETGIAGWRISQGGAAVAAITTGAGGAFTATLDPGTYTFAEVLAASPWMQTGNTTNQSSGTNGATSSLNAKSYTVVIPNDQPSSVTGVYFGNVCTGAGGGLTMGFWSNKNGQALITTTATTGDLAMLSALNLRNANGSNFDPGTKDAYRTWLLSANATNMAYMLSAQLSAMELNVAHSFVQGSALIYAPGVASANAAGFASVSAVMAEANTELGLHADTTSGSALDAFRSYQEALKNALDRANNNLNFLESGPASCPAPVFPQ